MYINGDEIIIKKKKKKANEEREEKEREEKEREGKGETRQKEKKKKKEEENSLENHAMYRYINDVFFLTSKLFQCQKTLFKNNPYLHRRV